MSDRRESARTTVGAAACITLALGGAVDPLFAPACFVFILFKRVVLDNMRFRMPDLVFVLAHVMLFVSFLGFAIVNDLARDDLAVLLGFATLWMALRMFAEATPYNDFLIVLSSLVITVGSAAVAPGLLPVMITALYLIAFCYAMPVIMAGRERDDGVTVRLVGRAGGWSVAGGFAVHHLSLAGLLLGSIVYLAVPRLQHDTHADAVPADVAESLLAGRQARGGVGPSSPTAVSGFPSSIRIGDIGAIKASDKRAFDVWIRMRSLLFNPKPDEHTMLLLRADAWDTYDPRTRSWKRWDAGRTPLPWDGTISKGPASLHYKVRLHGYDGRKLFVPQRARRVRCIVRPLFIDLLGRVSSDRDVHEYWVEADMPPVGESDIARLRPMHQERLTAVDEDLRRALMPFARRIGVVSRPRPGHIQQTVQAIFAYFRRERFRYTLQLPPIPADRDPVIAFLERREGHCELYATAACLFLRMAQIPARLAGGVRCAEPIGPGHYRARFRNAHAWVEIACKDIGFVAFDFTPGDSSAVSSSSDRNDEDATARAAAGGGSGARGIDWSDPFRYGHEQQQRLVRAMRNVFGKYVVPGIGIAMVLLIGVAISRWAVRPRRNRLTVHAPSGVSRRTLSFYVKWLKECAAHGHRRRGHQTPREFLATLPDQLRADGRAITAKFESLRYGSAG